MNEIKEKIKDLELALNYVCYDADLIPKLQTVWQKLELLQEAVNKNDLLPDVSQHRELLFEFNEWVANDRRSTTVKQLVDEFIKEKFK